MINSFETSWRKELKEDPVEYAIAGELVEKLNEAIDTLLTEKEGYILRSHYGIGRKVTHYGAIAEELQLPRDSVLDLEFRAIGKLRRSGAQLKKFLDFNE